MVLAVEVVVVVAPAASVADYFRAIKCLRMFGALLLPALHLLSLSLSLPFNFSSLLAPY